MGFTTPFFLFVFFPLSLGIWTACRLLEQCSLWRRLRAGDWALLALSLGFYGWALFDGVFWLCGYVLAVWAAGRLILRGRGWRLALPLLREDGGLCSVSVPALTLALGTAGLLAALFRCKYWAFAGGLFPELFGGESPLAPLGISFLTFSAVSYLADVYRGSAPAGSLLDCGLYLTFFPKVISGPIVLWKEFSAPAPWAAGGPGGPPGRGGAVYPGLRQKADSGGHVRRLRGGDRRRRGPLRRGRAHRLAGRAAVHAPDLL